jgi:hypothetical protein
MSDRVIRKQQRHWSKVAQHQTRQIHVQRVVDVAIDFMFCLQVTEEKITTSESEEYRSNFKSGESSRK